MSTNTQRNQDDQEIDLSDISKRIGNFFDGINDFILQQLQQKRKQRTGLCSGPKTIKNKIQRAFLLGGFCDVE